MRPTFSLSFQVHAEMIRLIASLRSALKAPMVARLSNFYTRSGRETRSSVGKLSDQLHARMGLRLKQLSSLVEVMKSSGLPAAEAARIRQHFESAVKSLAELQFIKHYRTPLGLRAFARLFILILPTYLSSLYPHISPDIIHLPFNHQWRRAAKTPMRQQLQEVGFSSVSVASTSN